MASSTFARTLISGGFAALVLTGCTSPTTTEPEISEAAAPQPPRWYTDKWALEDEDAKLWECRQWAQGNVAKLVVDANLVFTKSGFVPVTIPEADAWLDAHCEIWDAHDRDRPLSAS